MFLLDSSKAAAAWDDTVKHVHDILTKHSSEIVASRQWDERRLAYAVDGHKKGTYLLTYFKTDGSKLKEIVGDCHLSDLIVRELILEKCYLTAAQLEALLPIEGMTKPRPLAPADRTV